MKKRSCLLLLLFVLGCGAQSSHDGPGQPVNPPPQNLWQPAPGSTPAGRNYVYLQSEPEDYVGQGGTYTYTQADARITVEATGGHLVVNVRGDEQWSGNFQTMENLSALRPGYYGRLHRYPFHDPVRGGLAWSGEGRADNQVTGWFVVEDATYHGGVLTAIDLRFEQHGEGRAAALKGKIHWRADDPTAPPGPIDPPPGDLWQPAPGSTPAEGNYVYIESEPGDYIGQGRSYTYTEADALMTVEAVGGRLSVNVTGQEWWSGAFATMDALVQLQPGFYGRLQRFDNPVRGGLDWFGEGRGSNELTGWFVIDAASYVDDVLTAIDLRFEQHSEGTSPALHGKIHWVSP